MRLLSLVRQEAWRVRIQLAEHLDAGDGRSLEGKKRLTCWFLFAFFAFLLVSFMLHGKLFSDVLTSLSAFISSVMLIFKRHSTVLICLLVWGRA